MQIKTNCEVYLCCGDRYGWNSDQLQQNGFVKKNEKVEYLGGDKETIYQKNVLGGETVTLPETSYRGAYVTIFVK